MPAASIKLFSKKDAYLVCDNVKKLSVPKKCKSTQKVISFVALDAISVNNNKRYCQL